MSSRNPLGWVGFCTQFFFGAVAGAGIGIRIMMETPYAGSPSYMPLICFMGLGAVICGLIAGIAGDAFWRSF